MDQASVRNISLFFFLSLLDSSMALSLSTKAKKELEQLLEKNDQLSPGAAFVRITNHFLGEKEFKMRGYRAESQLVGFDLPPGLDLKPWRDFRKKASLDEIAMVLWFLVFKISDKDISEAISISAGTVRYRTARAVLRLGKAVQNG